MPDGKILTLNARLRDARAEDAGFAGTRTLLEHTVVLWNPSEMLVKYDVTTQYRGSTCLTDNGTAQFLRDSKRRKKEMQDYLGLGRLLVIFVPPPFEFYLATGETRNEGTAAKPRTRRIVAATSVANYIPGNANLTGASGSAFQCIGGSHFDVFWKAVGDQFYYSSIIEDADTPLLTIEGTNHAVAAISSIDGGKVLFLPQRYSFGPTEDFAKAVEDEENSDELWDKEQERIDRGTDGEFLDALFELAANLTDSPRADLPSWSERFVLPKEKNAIQAVEKAAKQASLALETVEEAKANLAALKEWKRLISGSGRELERAVENALVKLGCTVEEGQAGRADRIIRWKDRVAVVEIKGLSKSAAEKNAAQLEKWVSEYAVETGTTPKGLLIANTWRTAALDQRDQPSFPAQMVPYSEQRDHCLLTSAQLLSAAFTATSKKKRDGFLKQLFDTKGILPGWSWEEAITVIEDGAA